MSQNQEADRRPYHETILRVVAAEIRKSVSLSSEEELSGFFVLMHLIDRTTIPPGSLPAVLDALFVLRKEYKGQVPVCLVERLEECISSLKLYQTELVEARRLGASVAWVEPEPA